MSELEVVLPLNACEVPVQEILMTLWMFDQSILMEKNKIKDRNLKN